MDILDSDDASDAISWLPHGHGFVVQNKKKVEEVDLPKFFNKKSKYSSFTRRLARWDFTIQCQGHKRAFYFNPLFVRGERERCLQMRPIPQKQYYQRNKSSNGEKDEALLAKKDYRIEETTQRARNTRPQTASKRVSTVVESTYKQVLMQDRNLFAQVQPKQQCYHERKAANVAKAAHNNKTTSSRSSGNENHKTVLMSGESPLLYQLRAAENKPHQLSGKPPYSNQVLHQDNFPPCLSEIAVHRAPCVDAQQQKQHQVSYFREPASSLSYQDHHRDQHDQFNYTFGHAHQPPPTRQEHFNPSDIPIFGRESTGRASTMDATLNAPRTFFEVRNFSAIVSPTTSRRIGSASRNHENQTRQVWATVPKMIPICDQQSPSRFLQQAENNHFCSCSESCHRQKKPSSYHQSLDIEYQETTELAQGCYQQQCGNYAVPDQECNRTFLREDALEHPQRIAALSAVETNCKTNYLKESIPCSNTVETITAVHRNAETQDAAMMHLENMCEGNPPRPPNYAENYRYDSSASSDFGGGWFHF